MYIGKLRIEKGGNDLGLGELCRKEWKNGHYIGSRFSGVVRDRIHAYRRK